MSSAETAKTAWQRTGGALTHTKLLLSGIHPPAYVWKHLSCTWELSRIRSVAQRAPRML